MGGGQYGGGLGGGGYGDYSPHLDPINMWVYLGLIVTRNTNNSITSKEVTFFSLYLIHSHLKAFIFFFFGTHFF